MFRKTSGSILCPSCGRLTNADAAVCLRAGAAIPACGFRRPPARALPIVELHERRHRGLYRALRRDHRVRSVRGAPPPGLPRHLRAERSGAVALPARPGRSRGGTAYWWTIFTAIYPARGLLHILFNVLWIRQLGPAVEEIYGPARLVIIFTVAGAAGFVASKHVQRVVHRRRPGSIFGLLGAIIAYARKRGGAFGRLVLQQYGQWALILFISGFLLAGVNNFAARRGLRRRLRRRSRPVLAERAPNRHSTGCSPQPRSPSPSSASRSPSSRRSHANGTKGASGDPFVEFTPVSDLLSHAVASAVPSAQEGLTSVFGMGTGVAPPATPPGICMWR